MAIFGSFFDRLMSLYNEKVDTSYDMKALRSGMGYAYGMSVFYDGKGPDDYVSIVGKFNDYYDPQSDKAYLTLWTMDSETVIAAAVACHEVGHAIAHKNGFTGKGKDVEREASRLALEFLRTKLNDERYAVAERFLNTMLKSHKSLI